MSQRANKKLEAVEAALHERDAKILRESIQEFPGPVAVYDENDKLIACNELYRWVHGEAFPELERETPGGRIDYADLIRESAKLTVPPEEMEAHIQDRLRAQREADGTPIDRFYRDRGWFRIVKIRTPSGAIAGFATDITELKETTLALEHARAAAEAANIAKSTFLAKMSHELRTPLNAIIGLSEALEMGVFGAVENKRHLRYLADIRQSGHHLLALISDVLDLAKVEAGTLEINREVFDLGDLIRECMSMMKTIADRGDIDLQLDGAVVPVGLYADRRKVMQAFINVLSNAVKYSLAGGMVRVRADLDDDGLHLSVRDQGIGLDEDQIGRVFQPFGRLTQALASSVEGAGLGLPIAQRFIDLHGGSIRLASKVGQGTTVTIVLPLDAVRTE
ncbi:MAG: ATP-binding protein [Alphaproteobacteria bacterium]|nr:ATP-binding protein [Alphaproteobacteria bacterium]